MRYATFSITEANWNLVTRVDGSERPLPYGNKEIVTVRGLLPSVSYFFGIKAADEQWNWSPLSNIIQRTTCVGCVGTTGNVNRSSDGRVDLIDLSYLVAYLTSNSDVQICFKEANVDGSLDGLITFNDLWLSTALLIGGPILPECPYF